MLGVVFSWIMGVFKNIKSLFIEELPDEASAGNSSEAHRNKVDAEGDGPVTSTASSPPPPPPPTREFGPDRKVLDALLEAMERHNAEGFDYLEFRQALQSLEKIAMDEATRFKSAFALAQSMKAVPAGLIASAGSYLEVISNEEKAFTEALINQEATQIKAREARQREVELGLAERQKQIEALMAEMEGLRRERDGLAGELESIRRKFEETQDRFNRTRDYLADQIKADISRMEQYLK